MRKSLSLTITSAAFVAALALAGCSGASDSPSQGEAAQQEVNAAAQSTIAFGSGWAKAADGMSGVFGTLDSSSDVDITLVSATSPVAGVVELHESVSSGANVTMREVDGGFVIPAGGSFDLAPGGNHIMLMDLAAELLPGDEVPVTLTFDDGSTLEMTVLAKDYGGAQENYEGDSPSDSPNDHGSDDAHAAH